MSKRTAGLEDSVEAAQQYWAQFDERMLGHLEVMRAELARSTSTQLLRGSEVRQVGPSGVISSNAGRLMGWGLRNTDPNNPATVYLRDGSDVNGDVIVPIQLAAAESDRDAFTPGLSFINGLFVHVAAGAIEGAVYLGAVD